MAAYTSIDDPEAFFRIKLYAGNGSSDRAIVFDTTDTTMQPNLVWIKNRTSSSTNHAWLSSSLNTGEYIRSNAGNAETSGADVLNSIDANGFEIGSSGAINNDSGDNYVAWCWKESATAGFDIVTYTGNETNRTISHSLSAVPHVMIIKNRESSFNWVTYHHKNTSAPETDYLYLSTTAATDDFAGHFNDTAPTSSVFTVGTDTGVNKSSQGHIAFLFSEKQGFSKFGSYLANNSADGNFIYLGFRPAFFIVKSASGGSASARNWRVYDYKRANTNGTSTVGIDEQLFPNTNGSEAVNDNELDFLSNGVKIRCNDGGLNTSGETYVFIAFAEAPFVNSNRVPCNANGAE